MARFDTLSISVANTGFLDTMAFGPNCFGVFDVNILDVQMSLLVL